MGISRELTITNGGQLQQRRHLDNTILLPKELRDAIPAHSNRALVFDRVTGATNASWIDAMPPEWVRTLGYQLGARAQLSLLVHETGQLNGQFEIGVDLDAETMRALGQFLIQLADQAEGSL